MSIKNTFKHKFIWIILSVITFFGLAIIFIPPMINLNFLKPKIENIIFSETGIDAKIHGNINFSLLGKTQIIAHNISVPNGVISSCEFSIPFFDIFNLQNANISSDVSVHGASLLIEKIIPLKTNNKIVVNDSNIKFLNKEYKIINATISNQNIDAIVRTDQHKYDIKYHDKLFLIKNKNNDLKLSGELFDDGTAKAHIEIKAQDINRWFEFEKPRINGRFPIVADLFWNGSYGIKFYNISANGITGDIDLSESGYKIIQLKSQSADYDLSFFLFNPEILQNTSFDLDFYGKITFADKHYKHIKISTTGFDNEIKINTIIMDDMVIHGGTIDKDGAHNLNISLPEMGVNTTCLFNGNPVKWMCEKFSYGKSISGKIYVDKKNFIVDVFSSKNIEDLTPITNSVKRFGNLGLVRFSFPDMAGVIKINNKKHDIQYEYVKNKNISWLNTNIPFLPDSFKQEPGDFIWEQNSLIFIPHSKQWQIALKKDFFTLHGDNFKVWFPDIDLQCLKNFSYVISGNYKKNNISNLTLEINNHVFTGSWIKDSITLKTDTLNLDSFASDEFIDNYEQLSFFVEHPLIMLFNLKTNVALSANKLIFQNQEYNNFVYSLKNNIQNFSITDSSRGNLLAKIEKNNAKYNLNIQLNRLVFNKKLLPEFMPLNLSDTIITAEIKLNTYGIIAHDIIDNLNGTFDASFDGGKLYGLSIDDFYNASDIISTLNVEYILSSALQSGITNIKKMHIVGEYNNGNIKTLKPFILSMKHADATGIFEIQNNAMSTELTMVLRGTSPEPEPINLKTYSDNKREFSLSQIMMNFDPEYMREFIKTHDKF